ncbi:MAG: hypothetical protein O3A20_04500 [Planctomycetota bacterium]|nr:hypothetical protein [Planctomycetota bacterium]
MIAAALLLLAPAAQNVQHMFDVDRNASLIDWEITSSSYTINESPDKFRLEGGVSVLLDAASGPFALGSINGALMFTIPSVLHGEIPNPIPFLPPLATFDIEGLQLTLTSAPFVINPATGAFTTLAVMVTTGGTLTTGGLLGVSTSPIFGIVSPPSLVNGSVTQVGSNIQFSLDLDVNITQTIGTDTFTIVLDGPLTANADVINANAPVLSAPLPLVVGAPATLSAANLTPNRSAYLAGSLAGLGSTPVPPFGVTLALASPVQVGGSVSANAAGKAAWTFTVPSILSGRSVWFQALQNGVITQVVGTFAL